MRKQTKLVAVASAAALLAIGASMTSFAATGWVEEDGVWYYYDKDGNKVEDEWKKSGDNWYWLDSEEGGAMAVDKLIEDDDDTYYVDANGVMVRNAWIKIVNEDQDDEDDPAEFNYYYMQNNGKAYKNSGDDTKFRTIDGKRYAFDEDGKMLYGWVKDGERLDSDSWYEGEYYLGSWEEGDMKTGWQKITVEDNEDDDEEKDFWFHFKTNGKKRYNDEEDLTVEEFKINGKKYGFDSRGVMTYEWTIATVDGADSASSSSWKYFSNPEDGARKTKGWFKVVAPDDDNDNTFKNYDENYGTFASTDADDETERWYYANGDGNLAVGEIKKINGKYYGFRPEGAKGAAMLNGLCLLVTEGEKITAVLDDGVDSDELSDIIEDNVYGSDKEAIPEGATLFYFGNDEDNDGALKTGAVTVSLDGDSYNFLFKKSGGAESKGRGVTGIDDEKYIYKYGLKIKADSDDKYQVVEVTGDDGIDIGSDGVKVELIESQDLREAADALGQNDDGDNVSAVVEKGSAWDAKYMLVNTSGAISKKKTAAKDGDDWFFYVNKDKEIVMYTNNKNLDNDKDHTDLVKYDLDNWDEWTGNGFDPLAE